MKIYLIDPKKKWLKANLHCHTTNSDGFFTPAEIKKIYMEHGYQVVAFTDHELIFDNSFLTDENFVAITASEYSINDTKQKNPTYYQGNEFPFRDNEVIHLCMYSKNPHNTFQHAMSEEMLTDYFRGKLGNRELKCDGFTRVFTKECIQKTIDLANENGFLVQFCHPNWSLNTRDTYKDLKGLWGFEILNYMTQLETGSEYCPNLYDDMIRIGHKYVCTMNDDNHNFDGSLEGSFGGFNFIGVDEIKYENVLDAMEKGNIYCSSGPQIKSLYIDTKEGKIYVKTTKASSIILVGCNRTFRHYYGENLTKADFKIFPGDIYFRIIVIDKNNHTAHTHAYFIKDYKL